MDLTWYSRSDVMTDVVAELGPLHRHVRDRLGRHGLRGGQVRSDFSSAWKGVRSFSGISKP